MLFNSFEFICVFLPLTLGVFFLLGWRQLPRLACGWLVLASLFYYGWWSPWQLSVIGASIFGNYFLACQVAQGSARKAWLVFGIVVNLMALVFFKYANPAYGTVDRWLDLGWNWHHIVMPLGLSFYTFQQVAYLVDAYKTRESERSFVNYSLFVTFFPQLIIGPIVHHREMLPQFADSRVFRPSFENFNIGLPIFLLGLFKKVAIADPIGRYIDPAFAASAAGETLTLFEAWAAALGYTFQLYFDFSGYADMSIGIARMFGIRLPHNFDSPYQSRSMAELWRRWHMTLMRFMRDYVYIPLGGSRKGLPRQYGNLFITMVLCGLWHGDGVGWTFFVFGVIHGVVLIINHQWTRWREANNIELGAWWDDVVARALTFLTWCFGLVLFRATTVDSATNIWKGMFGFNGAALPDQVMAFLPFLTPWIDPVRQMPYLAKGTVLGLMELAVLLALAASLAFFCRNLHQMSQTRRAWLLVPAFAFAIQGALFAGVPAQFLYFQF